MRLLLGPRTLSWPVLALLAAAGLAGAVVSDPGASLEGRVLWLGAGVVGQIALTAVYLVGARLGAARSRVAVLCVVIAGAAARAAALAVLVDASDPLGAGQRMLSATVTFTAWGVLFGAAAQAWSDYRGSLEALLRRVDHAVAEADSLSQEWGTRLAHTPATQADLMRAAQALHSDIQGRLRPLSHRLWFGITQRQSRGRFLRAVSEEPLHAAWIAVVAFALYAWTISYHFGATVGILAALGTALAMALILAGADRLAAAHPRRAVAIRTGAVAVAILVPAAIDSATTGFRDPLGLLAVTVGLGVLIIGMQVVAAGLRQRRQVLEALSARVDALDGERLAIASHLHSTMQSRWTAAAMRLEEAAVSGDLDQARRALASARSLVDATAPASPPPVDLVDLTRAWEGIAAVRLDVPPDVPVAARPTLGRLVEEAIANAVRHGRARTIEVLVTVRDDAVDVVVTDDGLGLGSSPRKGLGSSWMDHVATWELTDGAQGARLTASIPVPPGS